jgi:hypothetical protein
MQAKEGFGLFPGSSDPQMAMAIARAYIAAGQKEQARNLLRRLTTTHPEVEEAWRLLLSTEPPVEEEIMALEGLLQHHPTHRLAVALLARLGELKSGDRTVASQAAPAVPAAPSMRISDYLIAQAHTTPEDVAEALTEQLRLRALGIDERIGTILLMQGKLTVDELADAFAAASAFGLGDFGDYLVRNTIVSMEQVARVLAQQAAIAADLNRRYLEQVDAFHAYVPPPPTLLERLGLRRPRQPRQPVLERPPKLGDMLVSAGLLTREEVERHVRAANLQPAAWIRR